MRGQFFILAAVIFIIIFTAITLSFMSLGFFEERAIKSVSENIISEYPRAFNIGLNASSPLSTLQNWSIWIRERLAERLFRFRAAWIYTIRNDSSIEIGIGNFLGEGQNFSIGINDGERWIWIDDSNAVSFFVPVDEEFRLKFYGIETQLKRDRANLILWFEIERAGQKVVEIVIA